MSRVLHDTFFKKAKAEGYVARSAYKLLEIQNKHKIIPQGGNVLDLGCSPGAWLQVACQCIGPPSKGGQVVGIDLTKVTPPSRFCDSRVTALHGDARDLLSLELLKQMCPRGFDVVLSDMCHYTHGNSALDAAKSVELAEVAWRIAVGQTPPPAAAAALLGPPPPWASPQEQEEYAAATAAAAQGASPNSGGVLRRGGALVMKLLQGSGTQEFAAELRADFGRVAWHRPKATRSESKEVFLVAMKRK